MEPFSALAVATSAVQFIDFTAKVLSQSYQLRTSATGQSKGHETLEDITTNLRNISAGLASNAGRDTGHLIQTEDDKDLQKLCQSCHVISIQLLDCLEKLKLKSGSSQWASFRTALRTLWSREEIDALEKELDKCRQQLVLCILVSLRKSTPDVKSHHESLSRKMTDIQQSNESLRNLILHHTSDTMRWRTDFLHAIRASYSGDFGHIIAPAHSIMSTSYEQSIVSEFQRIVLQKLRFREIDHRVGFIKEAHKSTFEWIWEDAEDDKHQWQSFSKFLKDDSNMFWITGRAGSGKSTLMKYLYDDPRTRQILSSTPDSGELVCAGFFFWNSGTQMQMSREALLHTLLYTALKCCENQISLIFPDLWEAYHLFRALPPDDWAWPELVAACKRLVKTPRKKFFFLVDGLDEYSNKDSELLQLVDLLETIAEEDNVKVCVSSRPWVVFEDAFRSTPSLKIEDLTFKDIANYVYDRLNAHPGYNDLAIDEPLYTSSLAQTITTRSNGVFLWVTLVVSSLLSGISDGDRKENLDARLAAFPFDLDEFFTKMLKGGSALYTSQACQIFITFEFWNTKSSTPLSSLQMYMADLQGVEEALKCPIQELTPEEEASKVERMRRRLNSRCKGLLESRTIHGTASISWIHRTAADFVRRKDTWDWVSRNAGETFDPGFNIAVSLLHMRKRKQMGCSDKLIDLIISAAEDSIYRSKGVTTNSLVTILDNLAHTLSRQINSPTHHRGARHLPCEGHATRPVVGMSFSSIAVHRSVKWYIAEKISRNELQTIPGAPPLLFCATKLCPLSRSTTVLVPEFPSIPMMRILLEAGATSNPTFGNESLIEKFEKIITERQRFCQDTIWQDARALLLNYGPKKTKRERIRDMFSKNR